MKKIDWWAVYTGVAMAIILAMAVILAVAEVTNSREASLLEAKCLSNGGVPAEGKCFINGREYEE